MEWLDALEAVVARTGVERYRHLCSDESPAESRDAYRALMVRLASSPPPSHAPASPPSPPSPRDEAWILPDTIGVADPVAVSAESDRVPVSAWRDALRLIKECPSLTRRADKGCGCIGSCSLGKGANLLDPSLVNQKDCFKCLRERGLVRVPAGSGG